MSTTLEDPFAHVDFTSFPDHVNACIASVVDRMKVGDQETLSALSLYYLGFLDRIIAEGERQDPDSPSLAWIKGHKVQMAGLLGTQIAEARDARKSAVH